MKIRAKVTEIGHPSGMKMSHCEVTVEFDKEPDSMTITVVIPMRDGEVATRDQAIVAAKELALQFCD